jgi:hypothetical protein
MNKPNEKYSYYRLLKENPVDTLKTKAYAAKAINTKHNQEKTLK